MTYIPYLLYFPMTDFSFSIIWPGILKLLPWIVFACLTIVVLLVMLRELERELDRQVEEALVRRHVVGYNLLFIPQGDSLRMGFNECGGVG